MSSGQDAVNLAMVEGGMLGPNPYTNFPGKVPQPGYRGTPTDAMGNPIATPPGMTLNSTPPATQAPAPHNTGWNQNPVGSPLNPTGDWTQLAPTLPGGNAQSQANYGYNLGLGGFIDPTTHQASLAGGSAGAAGPASGSSAPASSSLDAAIQMLSNPGKVTTPGANVPPAGPAANNPDVLANFLNTGGTGGTGAGGYSNKSFFDTLNALKSGGTPPQTAMTPSAAPPTPSAPVPGVSLMTPSPAGAPPPTDPNASVLQAPPRPAAAPISPMTMPSLGGLGAGLGFDNGNNGNFGPFRRVVGGGDAGGSAGEGGGR